MSNREYRFVPDGETFGFLMRCTERTDHSANISVFEEAGRTETGAMLYDMYNCTMTASPADTYLKAFVKWDGCSHFNFGQGNNNGYIHLCGYDAIKKHAAIVDAVYRWAFELMERDEDLDGPVKRLEAV